VRTLFSIVVPAFDRPRQFLSCLEALRGLEYPRDRFEVIVVDDQGAVPASATVAGCATGLDLRVHRQPWGGPAVARNTGAAMAQGQYLCFTDSDCVPAPHWLQTLEARFGEEPETAFGGRTLNGTPECPYATASQIILDAVHEFFNEHPGRSKFFAPTNLALSAELFRQCGGFDARFTVSEDREFCDRWQRQGRRIRYAEEAVVHHVHRLDFQTFLRRHSGYGRGARRFHLSKESAAGRGEFKDLRFYPFLLRHAMNKGVSCRSLALLMLVGTARAAYAAGYGLEALGRGSVVRKGRPAAGGGQ
jgi:glycosyltransferase involved in cell wall biosynthesis